MKECFISKIVINECRSIHKLEIPLSATKRQHLIITGKNGSGKTSLLKIIDEYLIRVKDGVLQTLQTHKDYLKGTPDFILSRQSSLAKLDRQCTQAKETNIKESLLEEIQSETKRLKKLQQALTQSAEYIDIFYKHIAIDFTNQEEIEDDDCRELIVAFFEAKRENTPNVPSAIQNIELDKTSSTKTTKIHKDFIAYMVKLRNQMLNEQYDGSTTEADKIKKWFDNFEQSLQRLFGRQDLKLTYYSKDLNFKIEYDDASFALNELSDGYSSLLAIITELILRMEAYGAQVYDMQGLVLIDEVETHLHVDLQKKVLPFLVDLFPNVQFIVTTHSPFVLSSLANAVIVDLEQRFVVSDLSIYSYDALIESYFDSDKYSQVVKDKLDVFETLARKQPLADKELEEFHELERYFSTLPSFLSNELAVKINEIKLSLLAKN